MIDCEPTTLVKGYEDICGDVCDTPYECTMARSFLTVKGDPRLAKLVGEYPCGRQAEILYLHGEKALTDEGLVALEGVE